MNGDDDMGFKNMIAGFLVGFFNNKDIQNAIRNGVKELINEKASVNDIEKAVNSNDIVKSIIKGLFPLFDELHKPKGKRFITKNIERLIDTMYKISR